MCDLSLNQFNFTINNNFSFVWESNTYFFKFGKGCGEGGGKAVDSLELTLSLVLINHWLGTLSPEATQYVFGYQLNCESKVLFVWINEHRTELENLINQHFYIKVQLLHRELHLVVLRLRQEGEGRPRVPLHVLGLPGKTRRTVEQSRRTLNRVEPLNCTV
jgi:hypothetical protein